MFCLARARGILLPVYRVPGRASSRTRLHSQQRSTVVQVKEVLAAVRKQGVEVSDAAAAAVEKQFEGMLVVSPDAALQEGHVSVPKSVYDGKTEDLRKFKEESRALKQERDDLKAALDASAGSSRTVVDTLRADNARLLKMSEAYVAEKKEAWEAVKGSIPEALQRYYAFPKEGEELSVEALLSNVAKLDEHTAAGVAFETPQPDPARAAGPPAAGTPRSPASGGARSASRQAWENKSPVEKIAAGYADPGAAREHTVRFDGK